MIENIHSCIKDKIQDMPVPTELMFKVPDTTVMLIEFAPDNSCRTQASAEKIQQQNMWPGSLSSWPSEGQSRLTPLCCIGHLQW